MESLIAPSVNLAILIVFLTYKLRQPIRDFVHGRHVSIAKQIEEVQDNLRNAQEKYDEITAKLKAIDAEIRSMQEQYRQESASIKQRIVAEAHRTAGMIISDANGSANGLYNELKEQLYFELVTKITDKVSQDIKTRLTSDDRSRIRQEFSLQVEKVS